MMIENPLRQSYEQHIWGFPHFSIKKDCVMSLHYLTGNGQFIFWLILSNGRDQNCKVSDKKVWELSMWIHNLDWIYAIHIYMPKGGYPLWRSFHLDKIINTVETNPFPSYADTFSVAHYTK